MDTPTYATSNSILDSDDLKYDEVVVPDWGRVRVRELTGAERERYDQAIATFKPRGKRVDIEVHAHRMRVFLSWLTMVDDNGVRLFRDEASRDALAKKSARAIEMVYDCSARLSGLLAPDEDKEGGEGDALGESEASL